MQRRGGLAEDQAVLFLQRRGLQILGRHITSRYGEIDILAQDGQTIVAVEVKARQSRRFGRAVEAVTKQKQEKIIQTLQIYVQRAGLSRAPARVDVITIDGSAIQHLIGVME